MARAPSASVASVLLTVAAFHLGCGAYFVGGKLPKAVTPPAPSGPRPSIELVVDTPVLELFDQYGTRIFELDVAPHVESATREAALFESFQLTSAVEASEELGEVDYRIRLAFDSENSTSPAWSQWGGLLTLFLIIPKIEYHPIILSADLVGQYGAVLRHYKLHDEQSTLLAGWDILLILSAPARSTPADLVENLVKTLYLQLVADGVLATSGS